ncbi:TPA: hypothetical protein ACRQ5K_000978 [Escherichia coli]
MQALLEHFITQSTVYSLMAVVLVAFLESLALVGLILPGTVLMAGLGALIGSGELSFWHAWLAGIVGCLLWPPFYFLPGILAGAAIDIPAGMQSGEFKWLLLATAVFLWVGGWLCWRLWRSGKATDRLSHYLSRGRLLWLTPLISAIGVVALVVLIRHPLMPVYIDILRKVVGG